MLKLLQLLMGARTWFGAYVLIVDKATFNDLMMEQALWWTGFPIPSQMFYGVYYLPSLEMWGFSESSVLMHASFETEQEAVDASIMFEGPKPKCLCPKAQ